jgi:hypothetical protein
MINTREEFRKMTNIVDYVQSENKKNLISQIIKNTFSNIDDYEKMTELVHEKFKSIETLRADLMTTSLDKIKESLRAENNTSNTPEQIVDTLVYFSLIIENVWLVKELNKFTK